MRNERRYTAVIRLRTLLGMLALVLFAATGTAFSAGRTYAVVVGVDQAKGIVPGIKGAANDARSFAERLRQRGIEPVVLLDGQATRAAIESAIAGGARADQLVFYFAGMGSGPNTPRLMTAESSKGYPLEDLDKALLKAGAGSTTVVLDTSFNGLRAEKAGPSLFTSRYYLPPAAPNGSRELGSVGADAAKIPGVNHKKICYITAARFNEEAFEDSFSGRPQGVFTHYLCNRLEGNQPLAWQTVQWDVAAQVTAHVDGAQNPNFPSEYLAKAALDGDSVAPAEYGSGGGAAPAPTPGSSPLASRTLWTLFNVDNVDPRLVSLAMRPNRSEVTVEEHLEFDLKVGKPGYLIVVEHSVEGTLMPVFPRDGSVDSAQVRAGQSVVIPDPGEIAFADRSGKERLKALLFDDREAAAELLAGLSAPSADGPSAASFGSASKRLQSRGIRFARSAPEFGGVEKINRIPVTADLTFQVVAR